MLETYGVPEDVAVAYVDVVSTVCFSGEVTHDLDR